MDKPMLDFPQAQIDAIIRTKRKAREPKACYPCHTRKVKCDRQLPCDACVKRDHPDLCSYERPSKKRQIATSCRLSELDYSSRPGSPQPTGASFHDLDVTQNGSRISLPREEWEKMCAQLRSMEDTISVLRTGMEQMSGSSGQGRNGRSDEVSSEREGIHAPNDLGGGTVHLGSKSVLAYMMGLGRTKSSQEAAKSLLEDSILPKLGLDNESATYPFIDLWSHDASSFDVSGLCRALPDDKQCREFFEYYRDVACTTYPVVGDTHQLESKINQMLQNRALAGRSFVPDSDVDGIFGMTMSWVGLFFAVLASGAQSSMLAHKERELTSQVYICCSYECLRMTNFLSQPSLEAIQTLLIIGNVLSYNMNPGCSYILLGMTMRMCLSLGLQVDSHRYSPSELHERRRVWWVMAWQDSHFSMSYDRPSATALVQPEIPYRRASIPSSRSYPESMFCIISLTLEIVRLRMLSPRSTMSFTVIQTYKDEIARILSDAATHLRDRNYCVTTEDHLERLAFKLHSSYVTSELCRAALNPNADTSDPATASLRRDCIAGLERTIAAYLELHSICSLAARSWIGIQRSISSAFLLAVLEESQSDPQVWSLLRHLEVVIAEWAANETGFDANNSPEQHAQQHQHHQQQRGSIAGGVSSGVAPPASSTTSTGGPAAVVGSRTNSAVYLDPPSQQFAKPMAKALKALQKLNAVFAAQEARGAGQLGLGSAGAGKEGMVMAVTPESSTSASGSGDWTFMNIYDRAQEYIPPPLWG